MPSYFFRFCLLISATLVLSSCVDFRTPIKQSKFQTISFAERSLALNKLTFWRAEGVFSIRYHDPQRILHRSTVTVKKAEIAHFTWEQNGSKEYRIHIASTLNLYQLEILGRLQSVTLWKNGTIAATARTPEGLMKNAVGWYLPIANLYYWIRGIPAPGASDKRYDRFGHLEQLIQQGWTIYYANYRTINNIDLPQTMTVTRPDTAIKIEILHWDQLMRHFSTPEMK